MRIFYWGKDGGKESHVWGFWFIEIKSLFSVVLLVFEEGSREAYHTHAFDALTWFLKGAVLEHLISGKKIRWSPSVLPKLTPKSTFHKVVGIQRTYALSFRGPWKNNWQEYLPQEKRYVKLTNGRKEVA